MKSGFVMRYRLIRLRPSLERGEVFNVGVLGVVPQLGFIGHRLRRDGGALARYGGDPGGIEFTLAWLRRKLEHVESPVGVPAQLKLFESADVAWHFDELSRLREGVVVYSEERSTLCDQPGTTLDTLFSRYVDRPGSRQESASRALTAKVGRELNRLSVASRFRSHVIATPLYRAKFPFVEISDDQVPMKVIKPLSLAFGDPKPIADVADMSRSAVERLRRSGALPGAVLFVTEPPKDEALAESPYLRQVYDDVLGDFCRSHIDVVDNLQDVSFARFVRNGVPELHS